GGLRGETVRQEVRDHLPGGPRSEDGGAGDVRGLGGAVHLHHRSSGQARPLRQRLARVGRQGRARPLRVAAQVSESLGVLVAFSAGLFSFLSPCVLPLFPSYLSFITGMSVDRLTNEVTAGARTRVLLHSVAFILGFSVVFVSLGASFSMAGQFLLDYRDWIRIGGGLLIIVFGLYLAGVLPIGLLTRSAQIEIRSKPAGLAGSFAVGLTFAIGWTPCVGPVLGSILTLAGNDKT